jgi:branched-chain amino acid transport system permease protein
MLGYHASDYLQLMLSGLSTGSIYALIALGFVTIYTVTGIINFAQGEFAMLGAMLAVSYSKVAPLAVAALGAVLTVTLLGLAIERSVIRPAQGSSSITLIIITIGVDIALRGLALLVWGTTPYALPSFTAGPPLVLFGAVLSRQRLWIVGTTVVVLLGLWFFLERTILGKAVRACAVNPRAADLMGISPRRMSAFSFALSAALGAVAGIVIAPLTLVSYDIGLMLGLKGFVAAVMGGLVNAPAAVVGGLLLGLLESYGAGLISSGFKDAIAFLLLFIILFLKPEGLFARGEAAQSSL